MSSKKSKHSIIIKIDQPDISVVLKLNNKEIDEIKWDDNNQTSVKLLFNIDNILNKNKIKKENISNIDVETLQTTYSSARISKATSLVAGYCLTNFPKHVK